MKTDSEINLNLNLKLTALIILLLIIIALIIRIIPFTDYTYFRGPYTHNQIYQTMNVINYGKLATLNGSDINYFSPSAIGIYSYVDLPFYVYFNSILSIIIGISNSDDLLKFYALFPWQGLLLVPLIMILIGNKISNILDLKLSKINTILIVALSLFGGEEILFRMGTAILPWNFGFIIFLMLFYHILCIISNNNVLRNTFFSLLYLFIIFPFYYTFTIYIGIFFIGIYISKIKNKSLNLNGLILTYIVSFVSYYIYVATHWFILGISFIKSIHKYFDVSSQSQILNVYRPTSPPIYQISKAIAGVFTLIIFWMFLKNYLFSKYNFKDLNKIKLMQLTFSLLISLCIGFLVFFVWNGFIGALTRVEILATFCTIIILIVMLILNEPTKNKKFYQMITILFIFFIVISYNFNMSRYGLTMSFSEHESSSWIIDHTSKNDKIFSDLRLSSLLILADHKQVVGLEALSQNPLDLKSGFENIYLKNNIIETELYLNRIFRSIEGNEKYLYFSKRMSSEFPGIIIPDYNLKGFNFNFWEKFDETTDAQKVYSNGITLVYSWKN